MNSKYNLIQAFFLIIIALIFFPASGCTITPNAEKSFANPPMPNIPLTEELEPGLTVLYFYERLNDLFFMKKGKIAKKSGKPGPPVTSLDHKFAEGQEILDSGKSTGVSLEMTGFIKIEQTGQYIFQSNSNDGFRLYIDGKLLIDDPDVHADHLSEEAPFDVATPGWYWIGIRYFQKGHGAALQLFWKTPGANEFEIVPGNVLGHVRNS